MFVAALGAIFGIVLRYIYLNPLRVVLGVFFFWISCHIMAGLYDGFLGVQTARAQGLSLVIGDRDVLTDDYGVETIRLRVRVVNQTGSDIHHFTAQCGKYFINDVSGIRAKADETRAYEVGQGDAVGGTCHFSRISYGTPEGFAHPLTYGRME